MKTKLMTLILMLTGRILFAQQSDTLYYNLDWQSCDKDSYSYYRITQEMDSKIKVLEYAKEGQLQMEGYYESLQPEIEDGHFILYNEKGKKEIEGDFSKGIMVNKWNYYDKKGKVEKKIDYNFLLKTDETLVYKELVEKLVQSGGVVEDMPIFNNGTLDNFKNYILTNFVYPPIPKKYNIQGKIILLFIVNKKGEIVNAEIKNSISPQIDTEIMRIISSTPLWRPGKNKNQLINVPMVIPIAISLQ